MAFDTHHTDHHVGEGEREKERERERESFFSTQRLVHARMHTCGARVRTNLCATATSTRSPRLALACIACKARSLANQAFQHASFCREISRVIIPRRAGWWVNINWLALVALGGGSSARWLGPAGLWYGTIESHAHPSHPPPMVYRTLPYHHTLPPTSHPVARSNVVPPARQTPRNGSHEHFSGCSLH